MVDLPPKNVGGMEINWAYVEQRIADAIETGETDEFEFSFHRLELGHVLGKGAFGQVFIADAFGICGDSGRKTVAVKKIKGERIKCFFCFYHFAMSNQTLTF